MAKRIVFFFLILILGMPNPSNVGFVKGQIAYDRVVQNVDKVRASKPKKPGYSTSRSDVKRNDFNQEKSAIRFELSPHFLSEAGGSYKEGGPISLRCTFVNISAHPQDIVLSDHNDYSGTLPFPVGLVARVWDSSGELITENEISKEGWWSSYYGSSGVFFEKPGDRIRLAPKDKVIRIVPLDMVLRGCKALPDGLKAGRYSVQLSINNMLSNKIELIIRAQ